jgi:hypothetical protein
MKIKWARISKEKLLDQRLIMAISMEHNLMRKGHSLSISKDHTEENSFMKRKNSSSNN